MHDTSAPAGDAREQLRHAWQAHADALFEAFFPAQAQQPAFDQLEQRAGQLTRDLTCWLLEQRLRQHPQARPAAPPPCPRCGRPARRADPADAEPPERTLTTTLGDVEFARERWRCTACRAVFFPPR